MSRLVGRDLVCLVHCLSCVHKNNTSTQNNVWHWWCWETASPNFSSPRPRPQAHLSAHVWGSAPSLQRTAARGHGLHPGCGPGSGQTGARPWCWVSSCASGWHAPPSSGTWKLEDRIGDSFVSGLSVAGGEEAGRGTMEGSPARRSARSADVRVKWRSQPTGPWPREVTAACGRRGPRVRL